MEIGSGGWGYFETHPYKQSRCALERARILDHEFVGLAPHVADVRQADGSFLRPAALTMAISSVIRLVNALTAVISRVISPYVGISVGREPARTYTHLGTHEPTFGRT
jgi:hypothetical protein